MCQCRPTVAPEATGEREEERKSEAREESESSMWRRGDADSPIEESEAREERARQRCGGEPRARRESESK